METKPLYTSPIRFYINFKQPKSLKMELIISWPQTMWPGWLLSADRNGQMHRMFHTQRSTPTFSQRNNSSDGCSWLAPALFTPALHGYHGVMRVGTGNHVDRANPLCLNYPTTKGPEPRFGSTVRQWSRQVDLSTLSCLFNRNPKTRGWRV